MVRSLGDEVCSKAQGSNAVSVSFWMASETTVQGKIVEEWTTHEWVERGRDPPTTEKVTVTRSQFSRVVFTNYDGKVETGDWIPAQLTLKNWRAVQSAWPPGQDRKSTTTIVPIGQQVP
jgi:hypothetical protein